MRALPALDVVINSAASIREDDAGPTPGTHARALQTQTGGLVATDGEHELLTPERDGTAHTVRPPAVNPTDTTGAGDSFQAGLICGLHHGWPLPDRLRWATAVAALQVQRSLIQAPPPGRGVIEALARVSSVSLSHWPACNAIRGSACPPQDCGGPSQKMGVS